jgi:hypothetical protein
MTAAVGPCLDTSQRREHLANTDVFFVMGMQVFVALGG